MLRVRIVVLKQLQEANSVLGIDWECGGWVGRINWVGPSDKTESDRTGEGFVVEVFVVIDAGCTLCVSENERSGIGGKLSS